MDVTFGHISDTHLGAMPYGVPEREDDFYGAFGEALDSLVRDGVKFIVHSGDIFDTPRPPGTALYKLARRLMDLRERGIGFYFVLGEHDISRMRETPSPLLYQALGLATELKSEPVLNGEVELVGLHKRRKAEAGKLREELAGIGAAPPRGSRRILVLHQGIIEANKYAGEISAQDLPRGFHYYAMGHLHDRYEHRFEFLGGPLCYPGSTEITLNEGIEPKEKGFYIVDMSGDEPSPQWVKLRGTRPHVNFSVRYEDLRDFAAELASRIREMERKPMVRIEITGKDMRNEEIIAAIKQFEADALYLEWAKHEVEETGRVVTERPEDLRGKMMELAAGIMGSEDLAAFALEELLPQLRSGDVESAVGILYDAFKRGRFGL
ncbi:MAG: DNA repair exonuclease [Nitrososphaeria archaeon]